MIWKIPFASNAEGVTRALFDGWTVTGIFSARTGTPFTVFDGTNVYSAQSEIGGQWTAPVHVAPTANANSSITSILPANRLERLVWQPVEVVQTSVHTPGQHDEPQPVSWSRLLEHRCGRVSQYQIN